MQSRGNRDNRTAIGLLLAGIRGWDAGWRREFPEELGAQHVGGAEVCVASSFPVVVPELRPGGVLPRVNRPLLFEPRREQGVVRPHCGDPPRRPPAARCHPRSVEQVVPEIVGGDQHGWPDERVRTDSIRIWWGILNHIRRICHFRMATRWRLIHAHGHGVPSVPTDSR